MNSQYIAHVGFRDTNPNVQAFFSTQTVDFIQSKVVELFRYLHHSEIIVPHDKIINVMNAVYQNFRPTTGDIMTRYSIPSNENDNYIDKMINQVLQIITSDIETNLLMEQQNKSLNIYATILGDSNPWGLRQYSTIKLRNKRPHFLINMNY